MVLADGVAIAVGAVLHKRLPEHFLHGMAIVLFLLFGLWLLIDGALGLRWVAVGVTATAGGGNHDRSSGGVGPQPSQASAGAATA